MEKNKDDLAFIFPSQFIKLAHNFYTIKIDKIGPKHYLISNAKELKELRFNHKIQILKSKNIESIHYNQKLDVTYLTIGPASQAEILLK